jgi:hypothetical protein
MLVTLLAFACLNTTPSPLALPRAARFYEQHPRAEMLQRPEGIDPFALPAFLIKKPESTNLEEWTGFADRRTLVLPTAIMEKYSSRRGRGFTDIPERTQTPWYAAVDCRLCHFEITPRLVRYELEKREGLYQSHYIGFLESLPHIKIKSNTLEDLEARLLAAYYDYVRQLLEEDIHLPRVVPSPPVWVHQHLFAGPHY